MNVASDSGTDRRSAVGLLQPADTRERMYVVHGELVMLDDDVADQYSVPLSKIRQTIRRHPALQNRDIAFRVDDPEDLPKEFVPRLKPETRGPAQSLVRVPHLTRARRKNAPWAITERGITMLSIILRPELAPATTLDILRRFEDYRTWLDSHQLWGFFDESV
jgi:ORF6N domain